MQALVEISGKQFIAEKEMTLKVPTQTGSEGDKITFDKVLYVSNDKEKVFGSPYVENAKVTAKLISHGKHDKIKVFKMKRRKDYRRTYGHRQSFSQVQIESISS